MDHAKAVLLANAEIECGEGVDETWHVASASCTDSSTGDSVDEREHLTDG